MVHAVAAGLADCLAAAFVFVVRGDVADSLVEPDRVVLDPDGVELGAQDGRVFDREQVRPLALDGAVQRFDPGLVGGGGRAAEVLGDGQQGVMKVRVFREIICDPLSETASRIGLSPSSAAGSTRPVPARSSAASSRPSASNAAVNAFCTWVWVSSTETRWVSHLRETRSSMINTVIPHAVKCVES